MDRVTWLGLTSNQGKGRHRQGGLSSHSLSCSTNGLCTSYSFFFLYKSQQSLERRRQALQKEAGTNQPDARECTGMPPYEQEWIQDCRPPKGTEALCDTWWFRLCQSLVCPRQKSWKVGKELLPVRVHTQIHNLKMPQSLLDSEF